jgi:hypothetical protein
LAQALKVLVETGEQIILLGVRGQLVEQIWRAQSATFADPG